MNTLYIAKDSFIHRLDPRTKMIYLLAGIVCSFLIADAAQLAAFILLMLPLILMGKIFKQYVTAMLALSIFVAFILFIQGIYGPMGQTPIFTLFGLVYKYESLEFAAALSLRIYSIGTVTTLFVVTTHPSDMASALIKWKVPHSAAFMVLSTFQIIPILQREASIIIQAQQARCLDVKANLMKRVKNLVPLLAPLFIITFMKIYELSQVMECRAFSSTAKKTSLRENILGLKDYVCMAVSALLIAASACLRFLAPKFTNEAVLIGIFIFCVTFIAYGLTRVVVKQLAQSMKTRGQAA